jgi:hypothetical protein
MFDLEKAIADWRRQMLAAGINSPAPLEELESHLREEIERQLKSGSDVQDAFNSAGEIIGQANPLKMEFKKAGGHVDWLGEDKSTRINRILGLLWMVYCVGSFYNLTSGISSAFNLPDFRFTSFFFLAVLMDLIYLRGMVASVLLFGGAMCERRVILFIAVLDAVGGVAVMMFKPFQPLSCSFTILGFVTIWLLWPLQKTKLATR